MGEEGIWLSGKTLDCRPKWWHALSAEDTPFLSKLSLFPVACHQGDDTYEITAYWPFAYCERFTPPTRTAYVPNTANLHVKGDSLLLSNVQRFLSMRK